jgi:hypothetical protein
MPIYISIWDFPSMFRNTQKGPISQKGLSDVFNHLKVVIFGGKPAAGVGCLACGDV